MTNTTNKQEEKAILIELKEKLDESLRKREEVIEQDNVLYDRSKNAQLQIVDLEEEIKKLKEERPKLLADDKDVSKINKRLKEIDEQIEICKDTIKGIEDKREKVKSDIFFAKQDANGDYINYLQQIIQNLKKDYLKTATKFADILTEMLALNTMCEGAMGYHAPVVREDEIRIIPDPYDNKKELFRNRPYQLARDNRGKLMNKYDIPEYQVERLGFLP